ncbi:MAG TPA: patatin-like phospholipase family protein [Myxococcota bacterium]|nr:patatin-like phospholipase family protein [Myxococcota bacterium]
MKSKIGLVLTGGGARGAYQAGVLLGISEITPPGHFPFPVIAGISAGSINAAFLACSEGSFHDSAKKLWDLWHNIKTTDVFQPSKTGFAKLAIRSLINLMAHSKIFTTKLPDALLDDAPLKELLDRTLCLQAIEERIKRGDLYGVGFSATDFSSQTTTTFFEAHQKIDRWLGKDCLGIKSHLTTAHVLASSAIPGIFRLVEVDGSYYGDGSTRVTFPIAPAIHLGADKLLAIDMRHERSVFEKKQQRCTSYPKLTEIFATLLDAIFSDSLDRDLERLEIINKYVSRYPDSSPRKWRTIPFLLMRPSRSLASLAEDIFPSLSSPLQHMLSILGVAAGHSSDLVSHLAFEQVYTSRLLELGRKDALAKKKELLEFLEIT